MSALENNLSAHVIRALLLREFRAAFINRYFQIFCALALLGGIAAAIFGEDASATAIFDFQLAFYFVSLFALLAGVGSAQAERDEWQLLFSQPLPRPAYVVGKFCSLLLIFAGVLLLLLLPGLFAEPANLGVALSAIASASGRIYRLRTRGWLFRARSRTGADHRRERVVASFVRHRSHRAFRGALERNSTSPESLARLVDAESARRFSHRCALRAATNSSRSREQNSARDMVDRTHTALVWIDCDILVRGARARRGLAPETLGGIIRCRANSKRSM